VLSDIHEWKDVPIWAIALVLAAMAPWCVGLLQSILEERRRERTRKLLREAGLGDPRARDSARGEDDRPAGP
jgi:hypothetical protein